MDPVVHQRFVFQAMFYMVLGYLFRQNFERKLDQYNNWTVCIIICVIYLAIAYIPYVFGITFSVLTGIVYDYVSSITAIIAVVMITKKIPSNRYVNYVGQNTLIYFALHGKVFSLIQAVLRRVAGNLYATILGDMVLSSIFALLFALLLSVLLIIPAFIINQWFPFVMGKRRTKTG